MGARSVIAVDVGSASDTDLFDYGDSLSGTWFNNFCVQINGNFLLIRMLLRRLNPYAKPLRILGMQEIQVNRPSIILLHLIIIIYTYNYRVSLE